MIDLRNLLIAPAMLAMCCLTACKDDPSTERTSVLRLDLDPASAEVVVPQQGGVFTIAYTLTNPSEDATVGVHCTADWVCFDLSTPGKIRFEVAENDTAETRSVEVEVTCRGVMESSSFVIRQDGPTDYPSGEDFEMTVRDIDFMSAMLDVRSRNPEMYYVLFYVEAAYADQYSDDEALFQADMEFFNQVAEIYGETLSETISYYCYQGDCLNYEMNLLFPSSEYVAYAYGIHPVTGERLTDITRVRFNTPDVEKVDVAFDVDIQVSGPNADIAVTPTNGYDGYYCIDVYKRELFEDLNLLGEEVSDSWMNMISWYLAYDYTPEDLLPALCVKGPQVANKSLTADCDYVVVTYAINDDALICSPVYYESFRTGEVVMSENEISLTLDHVGSRKAQITVATTNDDPYALIVIDTKFIEHFATDDEIAAYCMEYTQINPQSGNLKETVSHLQPECDYSLIAFGYYGKVKTTERIFRVDFTTAAAKESDIMAEAVWSHHYDSQSVAVLDAQWGAYAEIGRCLLPFTIKTDPAETGSVFYKVYNTSNIEGQGYTDETIINELIYYGPKSRFSIGVVPYDTEVIIAALAQDDNGDYGKLWKSERFTLSAEDVSDPQEFLDNLPAVTTAVNDGRVRSAEVAAEVADPVSQEDRLFDRRNGQDMLFRKGEGVVRPLRVDFSRH